MSDLFKVNPSRAARTLQEIIKNLGEVIDTEFCYDAHGFDLEEYMADFETLLEVARNEAGLGFSQNYSVQRKQFKNPNNAEMIDEVIHIMHMGSTLCQMKGRPQEWQVGHTQIPNGPLEMVQIANCETCQTARLQMEEASA